MIIKKQHPIISHLLQAHPLLYHVSKAVGRPGTVSYPGEDYDQTRCMHKLIWVVARQNVILLFFCAPAHMIKCGVKSTYFFFNVFVLIPCCMMHLIIWNRLAKYRADKIFRKWYFQLTFIHFVLILRRFYTTFIWQNETGTIIFRPRKCTRTQRK